MNEDGPVLVIGAAGLDVKGRPAAKVERGTSNAGGIRSSVGGVARNIAENLARLDVDTLLLTAVGDDSNGEHVLGQAQASGIDVSESLVTDLHHTGAYMALLDHTGHLEVAIDDMDVLAAITPRYLNDRRRLFRDARMLVMDANLMPETLETVVRLATQYDLPICADPTSTNLANRLCPYVRELYMVAPNVAEANALCDGSKMASEDREEAIAAAKHLVSLGVNIAIITLAEFGVVYADSEHSGHIPAIQTGVIDLTGAGDALTAGVIFGLLNDIPLDECVRLGVSAASLTLRSRDTVNPQLSVEVLYDQLII
jgi:pseudouridine kinase